MYNYLRPIDNRFQINNVSMPRPHSFKTKRAWQNKDAEHDINTGKLILKPIYQAVETTWKYKLIRDDQLQIIMEQVFQDDKTKQGDKPFKSLDSRRINGSSLGIIEYLTYEQNDFEPPEMTIKQPDGHYYFKDVEFKFTNMGGDI